MVGNAVAVHQHLLAGEHTNDSHIQSSKEGSQHQSYKDEDYPILGNDNLFIVFVAGSDFRFLRFVDI
jgi:hypothetical protein